MRNRAPTERALFLIDNLDLAAATGVADAGWEAFQLRHLNDDGVFRIETKSRQIAWSWLAAAESVAFALLDGRSSMFVSINQDEATEKIRYAKAVVAALRLRGLPAVRRDTLTELEFANGARLISLPARPPRGKARFNVYLDEFAHVKAAREIYTAALPVVSKGGLLRIGSSPAGASGMFWEVAEQRLKPYPGYRRVRTPWWKVAAFCLDVAAAAREAGGLPTAVRVERFGNERIRTIFENMILEDFQQEYECLANDGSEALHPWDEIQGAQADDHVWLRATDTQRETGNALAAIGELRRQIDRRHVEDVFAAGMDIGRTRDTTEIFVVGMDKGRYALRLAITLDRSAFDAQLFVASELLRRLPVARLLIDQTGIGHNLAENLVNEFRGRAYGQTFTAASKLLWATNLKQLLQQHRLPLPVDRDLAYQIHSIKRRVTSGKGLLLDVDSSEKHHADKYWALALAATAALEMEHNAEQPPAVSSSMVRIR